MATKTQRKTRPAAPKAPEAKIEKRLTPYERVMLMDVVLDATGGSIIERIRATNIRRDVDFTAEEKDRMDFQVTPNGYTWNPAFNLHETTIQFEPKGIEQIRASIRLLVVRESLIPDRRFDALLLKFFSEEELLEMAAAEEKRQARRAERRGE